MAKSWVNTPGIKTPLLCDSESIIAWVSTWLRHHRFVIHSPSAGRWSQAVLPSTVIKAINNNHRDLELWAYANPVSNHSYRRKNQEWSSYVASETAPSNWVLDLDNYPDISGDSSQDRIDCLIKKINELDAPLPRLITESSPGSFHLLYIAKKGTNFWTLQRRLGVAMLLAGVPKGVYSNKELSNRLKVGGVDYSYLKQPISLSKFRIPGSINVKHSLSPTDTSTLLKNVIVYGWINHQYELPNKEKINKIDELYPIERGSKKYKLPQDFWVRLGKEIEPELQKAGIGDKMARSVAEFLAKNKKMLKRNNCRISQNFMAESIGTTQATISRLLKKLVNDGFLIKTRGYIIKERSTTYGAGPKIQECMNRIKPKVTGDYDFNKPYIDGETNAHYMRDIHAAIRVGKTLEEITKIVQEKQRHKPNRKKRSEKEIANFYLSCLARRKDKAAEQAV